VDGVVAVPSAAALRWRTAFVVMAVVAFVLGVIGFAVYLPKSPSDHANTAADVGYYTLQLFVLGADPLAAGGPYNPMLEIARFLAPATTLFAVIETLRVLLSSRLRRLRASRSSGHAVVCGDGPAAVLLARNLTATHRQVVLVGPRIDPELHSGPRLVALNGDPTDLATLRSSGVARAAQVYACGESSAQNTAVILLARELHRDAGPELAAYAQVSDGTLCTALRARRIGLDSDPGFRLDFFALNDLAARSLLDKHPPSQNTAGATRATIVGFHDFGRAVLTELSRRRPADAGQLYVTVVSERPAAEIRALAADLVPEVPDIEVVSELGSHRGEAGTTYVCLPDTDSVVIRALRLVRTDGSAVVACLPSRSVFARTLTGPTSSRLFDDLFCRLSVFGILDESCRPERVQSDPTDGLARAIHARYVEMCRAAGDIEGTNPSIVPWADLPDHLRRSSFAQANHIGVKMAALGCVIVPAAADIVEFSYRDREVETLAELEHQRWVAERTAAGFIYGPVRKEREHPDLVDWDQLGGPAKAKDRDSIEFLPTLLARAGFRILRLDKHDIAPASPSPTDHVSSS